MFLLALTGFLLLLIPISLYNSLISKLNFVENSWAGVNVQLKKRYDLIPNLVESVKQFMAHEQALLERITELRSQAQKNPELATETDKELTSALKSLIVSVESYPQLKRDASFIALQKALIEVEDQLSAARRTYNSAATEFNTSISIIPNNL